MNILVRNGLTVETDGLMQSTGYEFSVAAPSHSDIDAYRDFLLFLLNYVSLGGKIEAGETVRYGFWLTKAVAMASEKITFWELDPETMEFVPGIRNAIRFWVDQNRLCAKHSAEFVPPYLEQNVVISVGVYEGGDVQGVRYPSPEHMSGWWITTDLYNGDTKTLQKVHAYHLVQQRPELIQFLGLPYGYRFYSDNGEVKLDPKAQR
ncbi:immunity protein Imm33 domain-containing protein [Chitinimonas lacunae]|uniref:Imm33-like domain-containing protein n=1 Tax=Chitinimonas lacunae TaxID=1963018 RepID=A0ABV8MPE8_9NEIS